MHNYAAWIMKLVDRTMMAGLYKAEKILKEIDDEEATSDEIQDLAHALEVICKSEKLMDHVSMHHMQPNESTMTSPVEIIKDPTKARIM